MPKAPCPHCKATIRIPATDGLVMNCPMCQGKFQLAREDPQFLALVGPPAYLMALLEDCGCTDCIGDFADPGRSVVAVGK